MENNPFNKTPVEQEKKASAVTVPEEGVFGTDEKTSFAPQAEEPSEAKAAPHFNNESDLKL